MKPQYNRNNASDWGWGNKLGAQRADAACPVRQQICEHGRRKKSYKFLWQWWKPEHNWKHGKPEYNCIKKHSA